MCEIVMSNELRHNVEYDFFHSRYDEIVLSHVMTSYQCETIPATGIQFHSFK